MSEINDQLSDTSSEYNFSLDYHAEGQQHARVVFENVADQYQKGEDVTAFFTILQDIKVNPETDRIGLLRVGTTKFNEWLVSVPVQFAPSTSGSVRHGTATFPSSVQPVKDDEFYQFCYILNGTKNIGSSIPFQLNCSAGDIGLLSDKYDDKTASNGLFTFADHDNEDLVVVQTKRVLTEEKLRHENRQLFETNRRLESQKDECLSKLDSLTVKHNEMIAKYQHEIQNLTVSNKTTLEELSVCQQSEARLRSEFDTCRQLCEKYKSDASQFVERCRELETAHVTISNESNQFRSQSTVAQQFVREQATKIVDLERRLMQADELNKTSTQRQALLEQQLRDLRLTTEKHLISAQTQLNESIQQTTQVNQQIQNLELMNNALKEDIVTIKNENEQLINVIEIEKITNDQLKQQLQQLNEQHQEENESAQHQIDTLRNELKEKETEQQAYDNLKTSFEEIKKRCVKHQKSEIEVKKQLTAYQSFINDLKREIQELTERLAAGSEEYKALSRKYILLQQQSNINEKQEIDIVDKIDEPVFNDDDLAEKLHNSYQQEQQKYQDPQPELELESRPTSIRSSLGDIDEEVTKCPMCYWEFPVHMNVDGKREHIEHHFQ